MTRPSPLRPLSPARLRPWAPLGARRSTATVLEAGVVLAWEHAYWLVVSTSLLGPVDWDAEDTAAFCAFAQSANEGAAWAHAPLAMRVTRLFPETNLDTVIRVRPYLPFRSSWWVMPDADHLPVCSSCHEPLPCRESLTGAEVELAVRILEVRLSVPPGTCWSCAEPITTRQRSISFDGENLLVPHGEAVAFHLRRTCIADARTYEHSWVEALEGRRRRLSCPGIVTVHRRGASECTQPDSCPGLDPTVRHGGRVPCQSRHHDANGRCPRGCNG